MPNEEIAIKELMIADLLDQRDALQARLDALDAQAVGRWKCPMPEAVCADCGYRCGDGAWYRVGWWAKQEPNIKTERIWLTADDCRSLLADWNTLRDQMLGAEQAARHEADWADQAEAEMKQAKAALARVAEWVANDAVAVTFQTLGQYRTALIAYLNQRHDA
jgi:hypothetical protein